MAMAMSSPGRVARLLDGLDEDVDGVLVRGEVRGEAALVADGGGRPRSWSTCFSVW